MTWRRKEGATDNSHAIKEAVEQICKQYVNGKHKYKYP